MARSPTRALPDRIDRSEPGCVDGAGSQPEAGLGLRPFGGLILALVSSVLFLLNTHRGIGVLPDSMRYMGLNEIPYDAPLYPWILQGISRLGLDVAVAAKLVGAVLAFANPLLIWTLLVKATRNSVYSAAGTLVIILAPLFVALHAEAMSEPLFLFFILCSLLALQRFLVDNRLRTIAFCGVLVGLAGLTRFTAPALGAAIGIVLLLDTRRAVPRRWLDAAVFAATSAGLFLSWVVASQMIEGRSTGRSLAFYGNMDAAGWQAGIAALTAWLAPNQVPLAARLLLLAATAAASAGLLLWYWKRRRNLALAGDLLPVVLALQFVLYLAFMALAIALEANLRFNPRYAFPVFATTVLMLTMATAEAGTSTGPSRHYRTVFTALALLVLAGNAVRTATRTIEAFKEGIGFASTDWTQSPTIAVVARLPAGAVIYSNGPDAVTQVTRRPSFYIPMRVTPRTERDDPADPLHRKLDRMQATLKRGNAYVVFLDRLDWRPYLVTEAALKARIAQSNDQLHILAQERDGRVYKLRGAL